MNKMELCYIRFGELPESEKSKNNLTGEDEIGVSVYQALKFDDIYKILLPSLSGSACVTLSGCLDRPMYEVSGIPIGNGSDGEPLLRKCKIVKEIHQLKSNDGWI
jgi:hypothetical protein